MTKTLIIAPFVLLFLLISLKTTAQTEGKMPKFSLTIGSGFAFQYKNTIQQPSESGTSLRLDPFLTSSPLALRFQANYAVSENMEYRFLVSPFIQKSSFTATEKLRSQGTTFEKGEKIETYFSFNSVRFGFANKIRQGFFKNCKVGVTLVVRKWDVRLKSAEHNSNNDNLLALPLLYLGYEKNITPKLIFTSDIDVLGFAQAYVLEGGTALNYKVSKNFLLGAQYRILSGAYNSSDIKSAFTAQNIGLAFTAKF
jgi:hypothetical protein